MSSDFCFPRQPSQGSAFVIPASAGIANGEFHDFLTNVAVLHTSDRFSDNSAQPIEIECSDGSSLGHNAFDVLAQPWAKNLTSRLEAVRISGFAGATPQTLETLCRHVPALSVLELPHASHLNDDHLRAIRPASELTSLSLAHARGLHHLLAIVSRGFPSLQQLDVRQMSLTEEDVEDLLAHTRLTYLRADFSLIDRASLADLQQRFSGCAFDG